jgi:HEPN domain-containing protein
MASEVDLAQILIEKARADEAALRALADAPEVPDVVLGFHAQQAVEKLLKAVLAHRQVEYEFRHDIEYLGELIETAGLGPPPRFDEATALTPWAVEFRYEDPPTGQALERVRVLDVVVAVREWAEAVISTGT